MKKINNKYMVIAIATNNYYKGDMYHEQRRYF